MQFRKTSCGMLFFIWMIIVFMPMMCHGSDKVPDLVILYTGDTHSAINCEG